MNDSSATTQSSHGPEITAGDRAALLAEIRGMSVLDAANYLTMAIPLGYGDDVFKSLLRQHCAPAKPSQP